MKPIIRNHRKIAKTEVLQHTTLLKIITHIQNIVFETPFNLLNLSNTLQIERVLSLMN